MATEIVTVAVPRMPRIHDPAPDFEATSAPGIIRLSDYTSKGKWILLFSHPADFTPVCTTEFVEFARAIPSLRSATYNCWATQWTASILTLWVRNIEEHFKLKVPFPVIADLDQKIAVTYGMVHEAVSDTAAVRAVFFIDPKQNIRAILYYPMSCGRNIDELLRVAEALQIADESECATPANWRPGDPVIAPAPVTQADAEKRAAGGDDLEVTDWYFSRRRLKSAAD